MLIAVPKPLQVPEYEEGIEKYVAAPSKKINTPSCALYMQGGGSGRPSASNYLATQ